MRVDEFLNAGLELRDAAIRAAADLLHGQLGEPPFDEAQPRAVRRRVVHLEARTFREPIANQSRLVGAVVIHDEVHVEPARYLCVNQIEEFAKLGGAVPLVQRRDHLA